MLPRSKHYEDAIRDDLSLMFHSGVSTRTLSLISRRLIGRSLSHEEVSRANRELAEAIERWRRRDLCKEPMKHLFLDGVNFKMRVAGSVEQVPVLVIIAIVFDLFLVPPRGMDLSSDDQYH